MEGNLNEANKKGHNKNVPWNIYKYTNIEANSNLQTFFKTLHLSLTSHIALHGGSNQE